MTKRKQLDLFECTESVLKCYKCGEHKPCSEFHKANKTKRGYHNWCKVCVKEHNKQWREDNPEYQKQWHEDNAEYKKQYDKQWREDNSEYKKQRDKQYREKNVEHIKQKNKQWREDNPEYQKQYNKQWYEDNTEQRKQYLTSPYKLDDTTQYLKDIKIYESHTIDKDGDVNFKCTYCGIYYKTTRLEAQNRLAAINGKGGSNGVENRFYCSDQCKQECPIYWQHLYTKYNKPTSLSREVQPQLRQMVLLRDNYTCQKCKKHKDNLDVGLHCHHIWPINESPITSADIDECMTLCVNCHKYIHMNVPGCGYGESRCSIDHDKGWIK